MKYRSRIRFNPDTKEIEIEGSEAFVKTYFGKIQGMSLGAPEAIVEEPKAVKVRPVKKAKKEPRAIKISPSKKEPKAAKPSLQKKSKKATKKAPRVKRVTKTDTVVRLIHGRAEGISTAQLKNKTGLTERQIWEIVDRAAKEGKVKKIKRGLYGAA